MTNEKTLAQECAELLQNTKNLILHGAPGTGKTYIAKKIAEEMNAEVGFVQFHPSYDYTDFVEGLRPVNGENGQIGFERKDGVFKNIHPSSVTKYAGMKYACDNGYAVFDMMGAGKPDEEYGVRDFKAEFGGELVEHGRFLCVTKPLLYRIGVLGVIILKKLK